MAFYMYVLAMVVLVSCSCSCSAHSTHSVIEDSREIIEVAGHGPDGVVWAVQLSDLHISSYHPDRAHDLRMLAGPLLDLIHPSLVLMTGDLTDAKTKDRTSRRQDEAEWLEYYQTMSKVVEESGLPSYAFYDLRGNHDKFGVPIVGGALDYFSKYSISSLQNRTSTVQSITLMNSGWKHLFVGVDTSMGIGLRGPCNLFGHPTDEQLVEMDQALSQWDTCPPENVSKVVFGHFPMSFMASTDRGARPEPVFAKHSISAYVCGHLHNTFGHNLIKHHLHPLEKAEKSNKCVAGTLGGEGEFWEWEIGDWRKSRIFRIIAIDRGHASYVDFDASMFNAPRHDSKDWLPTLVVPTYPLDSQRMERSRQLPLLLSGQDTVRALIFSPRPLQTVVAKFYDRLRGQPVLLEVLEMHVTSKAGPMGHMYEAAWNHTNYLDWSATRYSFQVVVVDSSGMVVESTSRPFSVRKRVDEVRKTWREFFVMGFVWQDVYIALMWALFSAIFILFILPKPFLHYYMKNGSFDRWSVSLFRLDGRRLTVRRAMELVVWFFLQGCAQRGLWWVQLLVFLWLVLLPWYWGEALGKGYPIGSMSLQGWTVRLDTASAPQSGLGWPDLMLVVLPYICFVIIPLYFLIFAFSVQGHLHRIREMEGPSSLRKKRDIHGEMKSLLSAHSPAAARADRESQHLSESAARKQAKCSWTRMLMVAGCAFISFLHFGQVCAIAGAYGVMAVLASPGFAWPVPILMIAAILQSSACKNSK